MKLLALRSVYRIARFIFFRRNFYSHDEWLHLAYDDITYGPPSGIDYTIEIKPAWK